MYFHSHYINLVTLKSWQLLIISQLQRLSVTQGCILEKHWSLCFCYYLVSGATFKSFYYLVKWIFKNILLILVSLVSFKTKLSQMVIVWSFDKKPRGVISRWSGYSFKRQFYKMVKHTQTIRRQIADELFECVWPFCGIGS